jgi:hypothetical protein
MLAKPMGPSGSWLRSRNKHYRFSPSSGNGRPVRSTNRCVVTDTHQMIKRGENVLGRDGTIRCYQLGCSVYVTKPVVYEEFVEAIKRLGLLLSSSRCRPKLILIVEDDESVARLLRRPGPSGPGWQEIGRYKWRKAWRRLTSAQVGNCPRLRPASCGGEQLLEPLGRASPIACLGGNPETGQLQVSSIIKVGPLKHKPAYRPRSAYLVVVRYIRRWYELPLHRRVVLRGLIGFQNGLSWRCSRS